MSGYYPVGAEYDMNAPYNEIEPDLVEVNVTVSITLSKSVTVQMPSYDFSQSELREAVDEQFTLPQDLSLFMRRMFNQNIILKANEIPLCIKEALNDCENWNVDDFEVIED